MKMSADKLIDWNNEALSVNRSSRSGVLIIVRPTVHGDFAVVAVDGSEISLLTVKYDKFHALNYARRCAADGWI